MKATVLIAAVSLACVQQAVALPQLDEQVSLSAGGFTLDVLPDSENDKQFYMHPIALEFVKDGNGVPQATFHHWGISKPDQEGAGANITFAVRPVFNDEARDAILENRPDISIAKMPIERSYYDVIITDNFASDPTYVQPAQLIDTYTKENIRYLASLAEQGIQVLPEAGQPAVPNVLESIQGGPSDAAFATSFKLTSLGGRLAGDTAPEVASQEFFAIRYRYMVRGLTPRFRAELKVNWKKTFEHFQARFGGGFWFWRSSHVVDIQEMKQSGAIELNITDGGIDEETQALVDKVFETLVNARINGSGMFAPQLKPGITAATASGSSGSFFGWSFNTNSSFQKLTEEVTQTFVIDSRDIVSRSFALGSPFGVQCSSHPEKFQNLSEPSKPCLTDEMVAAATERWRACLNDEDIRDDIATAQTFPEPLRSRLIEQAMAFCGG